MDDQPQQEILDATYRALCEHGLASLTTQQIADYSSKSKATIHYHYDSKNDLLAAFLEYLYEGYTERIDAASGETNRERLLSIVDVSLSEGGKAPALDFRTAMLEIKAQSPYDETFRDRLEQFDRYLFDRIETVIADGVDAGEFADVDPAPTAEFVVTVIKGGHTRRVAVDRSLDRIHEQLVRYIETTLLADGADRTATRWEVTS